MKIELGNFKNKIKILQKIKTKDSLGSPVEVDQVLKTCWAQQIDVAGSEDEEGKVRAIYDSAFIIKYDIRLANGKAIGMLVKDEAEREFSIESIIEVEFRKFLRINAVKSE
ncbi:head-tail adaptor protein [Polaribacter haliotis]|uniref:Head-tail adaptor protein n=1 Tax=Polaribacter haliotis TaxID=1888915 RepID=A0A7L8AF56_9FLAO|nr:head-tail adaptor protein [Polaribacter haliotis]QOD60653.1 head-tail adaptor protein [Polaribacter haliotis]